MWTIRKLVIYNIFYVRENRGSLESVVRIKKLRYSQNNWGLKWTNKKMKKNSS